MSLKEFTDRIYKDRVKWLELQFTDLVGRLRGLYISSGKIDLTDLERGIPKLDGSSVPGFTPIEESDLSLKPVPKTYAYIPWREEATARVICQIYSGWDHQRFDKDPRYVAENVEAYLANMGFSAMVGPELEYFVFNSVEVFLEQNFLGFSIHSSESPQESETGHFAPVKEGYHSTEPLDRLVEFKIGVAGVLEKYFGIGVRVLHHEVAGTSQHEINFDAGSPTVAADNLQTVKYVIRAMAARQGMIAVFMPKPIYNDNGSGLHVHVSIWSRHERENLFYDQDDEYAELSQQGRYFIGGLIEHGRALSAIVSPTVNSYRRLVPGYEAPIYLAWSRGNRSVAVRVPVYRRGVARSKRVEYRSPDPSANPYLAFSAIIMAGLDGILKKIEPGDPVDRNVYHMSEREIRELGIKTLPRSLDEALDELESDNRFLRPVFPDSLLESYIEVKREEVKRIKPYPSVAEIYYYLNL